MGENQLSPSSVSKRSSDEALDNETEFSNNHKMHGRCLEEKRDEDTLRDKSLGHASHMNPVDDEIEEGEIVEEDEQQVGGEEFELSSKVCSDVESGEIKKHPAALVSKMESSREENLHQGHHLDNLYSEKNMVILNYYLEENHRDGGYFLCTTWNAPNHAGEYEDLAGGQARKKSRSSINSLEKENHSIIDQNDFRHQEKSKSPAFNENSYCLKHIDNDKLSNERPDGHSEKNRSKKRKGDEKRSLNDNNLFISHRSSKERCIEAARSSSCEVSNRYQTVSCDQTDGDEGAQMSQYERQNKERNSPDHERSSRYGSLDMDKHACRSQVVDEEVHMEREGSFYGKHDVQNYRHNEDAGRRDGSHARGKEDERFSIGYRDKKRRHSSSKYDEHGEKYESMYREGNKDRNIDKYCRRDREMKSEKDRSRDRYRETERIGNAKAESERGKASIDMEKSRIRDREREKSRIIDREREKSRIRDREQERYWRYNNGGGKDSRPSKHDDTKYRKERMKNKGSIVTSHDFEVENKNSLREEDEEDYQGRIEEQLAKQDEEDTEKIKEESRKRRQAILEKYRQQQNQSHLKLSPNVHEKEECLSMDKNAMTQVPQNINCVKNIEELVEQHDIFDTYDVDPSFIVDKSPVPKSSSVPDTDATCILGKGSPKSERSTDMFCDDIFGESPAGVRKVGKHDFMNNAGNGLHDNWDDAEGYYSYRLGEVLDGRYEVIAAHGKGVFSSVVRVKDLKSGKSDPEEVAIKIVRSNDTMYKAGMQELVILKKLAGADPKNKRHCVRFLSSFKFRNHLCLVFESLHMNLREVLKKFGRNIGLRLTAVRAYAEQLFIALKHLKNCGVLHCDIKPDNILVNEAKNVLKLCDFGNAMFAGKNDITPYLVSRFYRAPEIILGLPYDHPLDIWSVGCCLFELYTGKVLFPGPSNNDMLRLHMELKGPFPKKMLRKGAFVDQHFDQDLNFRATELDPVSKKIIKRLLFNIKPKDFGTLISGSPGEDPKLLGNFKDLLEKIFILDPEKRITVSQALSHPFITGK